jgi:iron complex transport system substrate-binding protein
VIPALSRNGDATTVASPVEFWPERTRRTLEVWGWFGRQRPCRSSFRPRRQEDDMANRWKWTTVVAALALLVMVAAACGDSDSEDTGSASEATAASGTAPATGDAAADPGDTAADPTATAPTTVASAAAAGAFPVTIESVGGPVTIEGRPERVVSLSPTATEMLFAVGAGPQVVAVDEFSYFPEEAPVTDLSGYEPNVEAILGYEPDLVVLQGDPADLVASLGAAGVPALLLPAAEVVDDTYTQIEQLGAATGNVGGAAELVGRMQADIAELTAQVPEVAEPLTYYHELDDLLFSVTSSTFIGQIYALAGLENIADAADPDGDAFGYPQLSAEYLLSADPDLIFLADTKCCGQNATTLAARPGFDQLTALQEGNVVELDDDIASRWGPRIVDFLAAIVAAIHAVPAGTG